MGLDNEINDSLAAAFTTTQLNVINESHLHAGHAGDDGTGESHWRIEISAPEFASMSRIARHRAIHAALGPAIIGRIHALSLQIS
ncbi:MAG: BolA family protein [Yoonia sp.]